MKKTYVLDTNVLIQAPHALLSFEDNRVVLPVTVLEELDGLKRDEGEKGRSARQAIRFLEDLRRSGNLVEGVALPGGGTLRLEINHVDVALPEGWRENSPDNRVLKVCKGIKEQGEQAVLVTRDIVARIKAQIMGIPAEDYTTDMVAQLPDQYRGRAEAYIPDRRLDRFRQEGVALSEAYCLDGAQRPVPVAATANQFYILRSDTAPRKTALGRACGDRIVPLEHLHGQPFGVTPRNVGQKFMQEALLLDAQTAPLVIVKGAAGTAKTFLTLACGLEQLYVEVGASRYRKMLVSRPNTQFDEDIGFLPGSEQEKISPLMRPIIDNLEILVDRDEGERYRNEQELKGKIEELFDRGIIATEAMNFMRGRSITGTYLVIDEAQNLTPKQVKGIITRVGSGTKVVLLGDPQQIDNPLLGERTNGLSYAAEKMKGNPLCFQITMEPDECERSKLAMAAAMRM